MSSQCGLCLSCGAPFLPTGEDMVEYDRLGNISVAYFQKMIRNNDLLQKTVEKPTFCAKVQQSHITHQTHHKPAIEIVTDEAVAGNHVTSFPFMRNPTGDRPEALFAEWVDPTPETVLDFKPLADFILGLETHGELTPDLDNKPSCCHDCNMVMTMRFWFDFHLTGGSGGNASKIVPDNSLTVFKADLRGAENRIESYPRWHKGGLEDTYPKPQMKKDVQVLGAALGYYLGHSCRPLMTPGLSDVGNPGYTKLQHYELYLHMCWVVLEVTCLLCEYWRGSGDAEQKNTSKKHRQCLKSHLGAVELYFSYFCWRVVCFRHQSVRGLSFASWHQIYMWYASDCPALFPREENEWGVRLMADRLSPEDMYAGSKQLVEAVSGNMTRLLKDHLMRLGAHLAGAPRSVHLERYFLPRKYLQELAVIMRRHTPLTCFLLSGLIRCLCVMSPVDLFIIIDPDSRPARDGRGAEPDFDSFAVEVGIDAMMTRVIDLGRDFDATIRRRLRSFRTAWRKAEIQNVARNTGRAGAPIEAAAAVYRLCKLLEPPKLDEWSEMDPSDARLALLGPRCSPWAAVLALNRLGAFDTGDPDALALAN